jgi:hypothetical protein
LISVNIILAQLGNKKTLSLLNFADRISMLKQNHAFRSAGTAKVELPEIWAGNKIHCWIYFSTPNYSLNSISKYVGLVQ